MKKGAKRAMRILVLNGVSRYDVLSIASEEIAQAFRDRGHDATLVSCAQMPPPASFVETLREHRGVDFVFSIFGIWGNCSRIDITEHTDAPLVLQYVDPPTSHLENLRATRESSALLFIDPSHVDDMGHFFAPDHFAYLGFCPHAALGPQQTPGLDADDFAARRPIPLFFAGTRYRPLDIPWGNFPTHIRQLFTDIIDQCLASADLTVQQAISAALRARGVEPDDPGQKANVDSIRGFSTLFIETIRIARRERLFDALSAADLPVVVCGQDYDDDFISRHPTVRAMGMLPVQDVLMMMGQSRIVLNASAIYPFGSHERPFTAMKAGAVTLTDSSHFFRQAFTPGTDMALYRWQHLQEDLEDAATLLQDDEALFAMAVAGQAKTMAAHQWANRVDSYIKAGQIARRRYNTKK